MDSVAGSGEKGCEMVDQVASIVLGTANECDLRRRKTGSPIA